MELRFESIIVTPSVASPNESSMALTQLLENGQLNNDAMSEISSRDSDEFTEGNEENDIEEDFNDEMNGKKNKK